MNNPHGRGFKNNDVEHIGNREQQGGGWQDQNAHGDSRQQVETEHSSGTQQPSQRSSTGPHDKATQSPPGKRVGNANEAEDLPGPDSQ